MTLHANAYRDPYEDIAERIKYSVTRARGPQYVVVRPNGRIRIFQGSKMPEAELTNAIGVYDRNCLVQDIEDDLLCHLRELSAR